MKQDDLPEYIRNSLKHSVLTKAETNELINKSQRGDKKATEKLVKHNMRFVYMTARRYSYFMQIEDLMQEGVCGLLRAIKDFKTSTNYNLTTYSILWIGAFCKRAAQKSSGYTAFQRARERQLIKFDDTLSIDSDVTSSGVPIGDALASDDTPADETLHRKKIDQAIREVIAEENHRNPRSALITKRLGERGAPESSLEWIGKQVGVSKERIRQLEMGVKNRLRANPRLKKIAESA